MSSTLDNFTLGRTLGSGFSAKVKVGQATDGTEYALKIFDPANPNFNQRAFKLLREEVEATTQLNHENVVRYHDFKEDAVLNKATLLDARTAKLATLQEARTHGTLRAHQPHISSHAHAASHLQPQSHPTHTSVHSRTHTRTP